jgi:hypothetical protein
MAAKVTAARFKTEQTGHFNFGKMAGQLNFIQPFALLEGGRESMLFAGWNLNLRLHHLAPLQVLGGVFQDESQLRRVAKYAAHQLQLPVHGHRGPVLAVLPKAAIDEKAIRPKLISRIVWRLAIGVCDLRASTRQNRLALTGGAGFFHCSTDANIAQLVEQRFRKAWVVGSIPTVGSIFARNAPILSKRCPQKSQK